MRDKKLAMQITAKWEQQVGAMRFHLRMPRSSVPYGEMHLVWQGILCGGGGSARGDGCGLARAHQMVRRGQLFLAVNSGDWLSFQADRAHYWSVLTARKGLPRPDSELPACCSGSRVVIASRFCLSRARAYSHDRVGRPCSTSPERKTRIRIRFGAEMVCGGSEIGLSAKVGSSRKPKRDNLHDLQGSSADAPD